MAPIPRCDLRLPSEPGGRQTLRPGSKSDTDDQLPEGSFTSARPDRTAGSGRAPLHSHRSQTRDSAEILEGAKEFSTGVTRDSSEIREHRQHEGLDAEGAVSEGAGIDGAGADAAGIGAGADGAGTGGRAGGTVECPTPCAVVEESLTDLEAAAAAAVVDDEDAAGAVGAVGAGATATPGAVATPGDVCAQFCEDRPESPSSGYSIRKAIGADKMAKKRGPQRCKGTYGSLETYTSLWGSSRAVSARKKLELEMKKKRKYWERLHQRNQRRRERERRRAKEKRRMLRCRDQSKIPGTIGDISINKAFYFRFNYNKRLPFMPSAMDQHLKRFRRPPFRRFHKGSNPCRKLVDEFEKLRVPEGGSGRGGRPRARAKA